MTTDDKHFIDNLYQSLAEHFSSIQLIGLGTEEDVLSLKHRYDDIISAEEISFDFSSDRLILTSLDAFYEIRSYLSKFEDITFWFNPEFSIPENELGFLTSISATSLGEHAKGGICARSPQGLADWKTTASTDVPLIHSQFDIALSNLESEPLIEKKGLPRILIDGSADISNFSMVDAFVELDKLSVSHEIWCLFDGQLKSWMKPDFQVSSIVSTQLPLYLNSVDGVVIVGDISESSSIVDYLSLGKMPIVISEDVEAAIGEKISIEQVKKEFPSFGSADLLNELISDPSKLAQYNDCAKSALLPNTYFEFSQIENIKVSADTLRKYLTSSQTAFAQEEYLQAKYGNRFGSSLHKKLRQDAQIIAELPSTVVREGRFTGWTIDTAAMDVAKPLVLSKNGVVPVTTRRYNRADVNEHFSVTGIDNVGYASVFVLPDNDLSEDELFYAVEDTRHDCVKMHTMIEDLNVHYDPAEFAKTGHKMTSSESIQGCVETLTFSKAALINLNGINGNLHACEFRLQVESEYLSSDAFDVYVISDSQLAKVDASVDDDFLFSLASCDGVEHFSQLVVIGHSMVEQDMKCVISCSDPHVTYSPVSLNTENGTSEVIDSESVLSADAEESDATLKYDDTIAISEMDDTVALNDLDHTIAIAEIVDLNISGDNPDLVAEQNFIDFEAAENHLADEYVDGHDADVQRAA